MKTEIWTLLTWGPPPNLIDSDNSPRVIFGGQAEALKLFNNAIEDFLGGHSGVTDMWIGEDAWMANDNKGNCVRAWRYQFEVMEMTSTLQREIKQATSGKEDWTDILHRHLKSVNEAYAEIDCDFELKPPLPDLKSSEHICTEHMTRRMTDSGIDKDETYLTRENITGKSTIGQLLRTLLRDGHHQLHALIGAYCADVFIGTTEKRTSFNIVLNKLKQEKGHRNDDAKDDLLERPDWANHD